MVSGDDQVFDPATVPDVPAAYKDGLRGPDGRLWRGTAMWHGNPSIDQYTGPMSAFPLVHGLLRDAALATAACSTSRAGGARWSAPR